ncbi:MAG: hypothetical protein ACYSUY_08470 [Planctomycetota bacterium]|jgi:hypothetical protein
MRTLFIPLAKLLGIYEVFRALNFLLVMIYRAISRGTFIDSVVISCPIYVFFLILGLILIFKAERIADILKIPQDKTDSLVFNFHSILRVGLVLIGITVLVYAIPSLIGSIVGLVVVVNAERLEIYQYQRRLYTAELSASILRIVFGGCLVFLANGLVRFFSKHEEQT